MKKTLLLTLLALSCLIGNALGQSTNTNCQPNITFVDSDTNPNVATNIILVFFSYPPAPCNPACYVEGTRLLDPNAPDGSWEIIQPTWTRRSYTLLTNNVWSIGPRQRYVMLNMAEAQPFWYVRAKCFP